MTAQDWDPFKTPEHISLTGRYAAIDSLDRIYHCKQYEGRADWWTGIHPEKGEVPLREREPCVKYPLAAAAVDQVVQFLFGDQRFPTMKARADDASDSVTGVALSEDEADEVSEWISEAVDRCNVKQQTMAIATRGISRKTAVAVLGFRDGLYHIERPRAQDCWAEFRDGDPALDVVRMVWCYRYDRLVADENGHPKTKPFLFRRDYDGEHITTYVDVDIDEAGGDIRWTVDEQKPHGLGFCPVVWIRNEPESSRGIDGHGLYEGQEDNLEAVDFALSQRHTGIYHAGYPQPWETGVEDGDGPGQDGRAANGPTNYSVAEGATGKRWAVANRAPARRGGPQYTWSYGDPNVKVGFLETTGAAFEATTNHVNDARSRFLEACSVVLTSMADTVSRVSVGAQMSARFLALAHAPLIALVGKYRHTWWPHGLRKIVDMMLRMLVAVSNGDSPQRILIPGSDRVAKILKPFNEIDVGNGPQWIGPRIEPHWGRFFDPSTQEVKEAVEATAAAVELGVISLETAATHLANEFGVENPEQELEKAQDEAEERRKQAQEDMRAEAAAFHGSDDGDGDDGDNGTKPPSGGARAGGNKKRPRRRRRGAAAAAKGKSSEGATAQGPEGSG